MKKLRLGVIGCASIAERMMLPAILRSDRFELVAIASRTADKAAHFAEKFRCEAVVGYESLLSRSDINAVYMPLPTGLHRFWGEMALRNGKHLLLEKSLGSNLSEARELVEIAIRNQLVIKEEYMFEYHRQQQEVRDLVKSELGSLRNFRASFGFPPLAETNFRYDASLGGGALLDAGGYVLKSIAVFFPGSCAEVLSGKLYRNANGVDIWGAAMLGVSWQGQQFAAQLAFGFDQFYQCGAEFWGQRGKLTTRRTFTAGPGVVPTGILEQQNVSHELTFSEDMHFDRMLEHFYDAICQSRIHEEAQAVLLQAQLQDALLQKDLLNA